MAASHPLAPARWLFGPIPDLMLGCGGLYFCVLAAFVVGGAEMRGVPPGWLSPLLILVLGAPHYGATLLRVYEHRSQRRAYVIFSAWASLAVALLFGVSLFDYVVATWLVTAYLTWSPWHYTGQNYGLAMMFLGRRGVAVTPAAKRLVYTSFVISYALTFLVMHSALGLAPVPEFSGGREQLFNSFGIPDTAAAVAFPILLFAYAGVLLFAGGLLLRTGSLRDLFPTAVMIATQALWFSIPVIFQFWKIPTPIEPFRWDLRSYYFFWIALGHSTQYIWVTSYYARKSPDWRGYTRYLGKILLAGTAIWTLPTVLLDPHRVGDLPNTFVLAVLVAAAVNIHHFILDGAIWKLRDNRVGSILIRSSVSGPAPGAPEMPDRPWSRRLVWSVAAAGCAVTFFLYSHADVWFPLAMERDDFATARGVLRRLDFVRTVKLEADGLVDTAELRHDAAIAGYNRRLERNLGFPVAGAAPFREAVRHERRGEWVQAAAAYQKALEQDPTNVALLGRAAKAWIETGEPRKAIAALQRLLALQPDDAAARKLLPEARQLAAKQRQR